MTVAERVARGVALLDQQRPGWAGEIRLDELDIFMPSSCVLGQLSNGRYAEMRDRLLGHGDAPRADTAHGFDFDHDLQDPYGDTLLLNAEWSRVIADRQAVTP